MSIFEEVKDKLTITQVVEHYGFKVNRTHQFVCPFHNDHKPSASIKNDYFNCFVCGAGGDLISFTARLLGVSNLEACKELIREFSLNIETEEERKAQARQERKRKQEVAACSSLREKFAADKQARSEAHKRTLYRLRSERRATREKEAQEWQAYILHVGLLLAEEHRQMWQAMYLYPFEDERHIRALQELTELEYYLECYDTDPDRFCHEYKGVIERYERRRITESSKCSS